MRDRGIIYQPNGGGRDTYIYNDNGGFAKMKEVRKQAKPGTLSYDNRLAAALHKKEKFPHLHSRPVNYV